LIVTLMNKLFSILPIWMARISAAIIVVMPFHAFLTVWASSAAGHYTLLRLWKEALLLILMLAAAVLLFQPRMRAKVRGERLILLILAYAAVLVVAGVVALICGQVNLKAMAYGLLLDSRFLAFFCVTWLVTHYDDLLVRYWQRLLLVPAILVVGFATLQYTVLPADTLRHFGYGPQTISPTETVDQKAAFLRIQSTLRGANPFGAYLIVIMSTLGALLIRTRKVRPGLAAGYILSGLALVFTFSRSAWLGAVASMLFLIWISVTSQRMRRGLLIASAAALVVFGGVLYGLRDNDTFQNVFFHTNEHSLSATSSNAGHTAATTQGLTDIMRRPWGSGTGSAGPASAYNNHPARIAENYYVQIGQEAGVVGMGLFIAINALVVLRLWRRRDETFAAVLLASFVGITAVNMLMHAWTDDTLAYIWWGLAGAALAHSSLVGKKRHAKAA
jgi:hypothetical protein